MPQDRQRTALSRCSSLAVYGRYGGSQRNPFCRANQFQRAFAFDNQRFEPLTRCRRVSVDHHALKVRARKAKLIIEPEPHTYLFGVGADLLEDLLWHAPVGRDGRDDRSDTLL